MRNNRGLRLLVVIIMCLIVFFLAVLSVLTATSISRTNKLEKELAAMSGEIEALNEKLGSPVPLEAAAPSVSTEKTTETTPVSESTETPETEVTGTIGDTIEAPDMFPKDTYNYLALGNSITKHEVCSYWWGDWGMSASAPEYDYAHQTAAGLEQLYGPVTYQIVNFSIWELQSYDRAESLMTLENYLDEDLDLITLQLGENCYDMTTFRDDYIELVTYLQNKVPGVHVMILGDVWDYPPRDSLKLDVCATMGIPYADMTGMRDNPLYQCGLGTMVWGSDGQQHMIEHAGAAKHPSDAGMKYMADVILHSLNYWDPNVKLPMP